MSRAFMLTALALVLVGAVSHPGIASERSGLSPPQALFAEVSDRELFEMCCWAKGRAGFNHCEEYGICKDQPEKRCVGRGPAKGMILSCASPTAGTRSDSIFPVSDRDFFLLAQR